MPEIQHDANALKILAEMYRWNYPTGYIHPDALEGRFAKIFNDLGIKDPDTKIGLISCCIGRHIEQIQDLFGGEVKALLEESNLAQIIRFYQEGN